MRAPHPGRLLRCAGRAPRQAGRLLAGGTAAVDAGGRHGLADVVHAFAPRLARGPALLLGRLCRDRQRRRRPRRRGLDGGVGDPHRRRHRQRQGPRRAGRADVAADRGGHRRIGLTAVRPVARLGLEIGIGRGLAPPCQSLRSLQAAPARALRIVEQVEVLVLREAGDPAFVAAPGGEQVRAGVRGQKPRGRAPFRRTGGSRGERQLRCGLAGAQQRGDEQSGGETKIGQLAKADQGREIAEVFVFLQRVAKRRQGSKRVVFSATYPFDTASSDTRPASRMAGRERRHDRARIG